MGQLEKNNDEPFREELFIISINNWTQTILSIFWLTKSLFRWIRRTFCRSQRTISFEYLYPIFISSLKKSWNSLINQNRRVSFENIFHKNSIFMNQALHFILAIIIEQIIVVLLLELSAFHRYFSIMVIKSWGLSAQPPLFLSW